MNARGSLYRQTYRDADGRKHETATWWMDYYANGKRVRESTGTTSRREAKATLDLRLGRVAEGRPILPRVDKITYDEVAKDLRLYYETTGKRDPKDVEKRLRPLDAFFTSRRIATLTPADLTAYVAHRQAEGLANGSVNRELSILGTMLRHAADNEKLFRVPRIRLLKEAAPRAGFFEPEQYQSVRRRLRPDLQVACDVAYTFGWRVRDDVLTLTRAQVDLDAATVRLDPGRTKGGEGRLVFLTPALTAGLREQLDRVRTLERSSGRIIPFVFPRLRGKRAGQRIKDFRKSWATARKLAGCPGMLRHDFRRTAVRNLVNDGTPEKVAMTITGHRTRSVFDRYHIVSPEDLKAASARIAARPRRRTDQRSEAGSAGHSFGHSGPVSAGNLSGNVV